VHGSVLSTLSRHTKTDILTYLAAVLHANSKGECHPSAARIAALIGITRERAQTAIGNLDVTGLISAEKRPGKTSILRFPAFTGVSKFDTPARIRTEAAGRRAKPARRIRPVPDLDTSPVSNFDTQTDKEQSIDTGERGVSACEDDEPKLASNVIAFPEPCVRLTRSARLLRDEMLRGPVGRFFLQGNPIQANLGL
jgi:hypothetical protein